jgi:hypothetical protein
MMLPCARRRGRALCSVLLLGPALLLSSCGDESKPAAQVVVHVFVPQGTNPLVGSTRIVFTFQKPEVDTFVETTPTDVGTITELLYAYTFPQEAATTVLEVRAEDAGGIVRARGRSIPFDIPAGTIQNIGVLPLQPGLWSLGPAAMKLTQARALLGAAVVGDGGIMVAGGTTAAGVTPTVELFDLNAYAPAPGSLAMPAPRSRFAMLALNPDQVLMVGGVMASAGVDLFDGPAQTWSILPLPADLPPMWAGPRFLSLGAGTSLLWGGVNEADAPVPNLVRASPTELSEMTATHTRTDPDATLVQTPDGPRVLFYGGNAPGEASASLLDPVTGTLEDDPLAPDDARTRGSVVGVGGMRAVVAGGIGAAGDLTTNVRVFDAACTDPAAGCSVWSDPGLVLSSGGFTDARGVPIDPEGGDPRALFAGGVDATGAPVSDAVILDAETGGDSWFPLRTPRSGAMLLRLPTGQFVIIGGLDAAGNPLDTMEFFEPPARG